MFTEEIQRKLSQPQPLFIGEDTAARFAVMIPLVQKDGEWQIVFEVRALKMDKQPGDVSFPGGRMDAEDPSPCHAALREAEEELGVPAHTVQVLGALPPWIPFSSMIVYPFVCVIPDAQMMDRHNPSEVEETFTIPLAWLLTHKPHVHTVFFEAHPANDFPFDKIMHGRDYQWRTHPIEEWFYEYESYTVWGLTAQILKYFIEQIQDCRPK